MPRSPVMGPRSCCRTGSRTWRLCGHIIPLHAPTELVSLLGDFLADDHTAA
ncbi:hypothetical protein [Nocardia beijingensis]|uniref:hypothetical protein n=1 Tax=Nocardia beijingensis TaxID=95162 RepID=UPI0012F4FE5D|nr:hypothetical protein [Nocardia beijingensis]